MRSRTKHIAHFSHIASVKNNDASVTITTVTGAAHPHRFVSCKREVPLLNRLQRESYSLAEGFLVWHPGFGQRLDHQFRNSLVCLEIPMNAVRITMSAYNVLGNSCFEIHQGNSMALRPFRDCRHGPRSAVVSLVVSLGDVHRR